MNKTTYFLLVPILICSFAFIAKQSSPVIGPGQGFIEVEGGKIWYGIMGEGTQTPLLCMHGGPGGTSRSFYHLSEISNDHPVIMFDQLGSGRSDHHQDSSLLKVDKFV